MSLNFRHLHYFWVVAKEGSVTRAADRLGLAIQTVSAQLSLLEQAVGKALFKPQGRRLVLNLPGGGGFGDPAHRDPKERANDLAKGYVTEVAK